MVCRPCAAGLAAASCLPCPLGLTACVAAFDYRSAASMVTALKNGDRRALVGWLADQLVAELEPAAGALVTWAPTSRARRRARGFDQAELLARAVARRWGRPCRRLLERCPGPPQAGRTARERRSSPAFQAVGRPGDLVVVIDDVVTTGATLSAAARALHQAGVPEVIGLVAARAGGVRAA